MSRLIIHVGPPKCGSSTIQSFLKQKPFFEKVKFRKITAKKIDSFTIKKLDSDSFKTMVKHISSDLRRNEAVIISHEYLFGNTEFIENICRLTHAEEIRIIGYARPQSGFLISAYSQWEFRSKDSYDFHSRILKEKNVKSIYFTGLEAYIVSVILSDFNSELKDPRYRIYNWDLYYEKIKKSVPNSILLVDSLPSKTHQYNLIKDFCKKANLTAKHHILNKSKKKVNVKFDIALTESIYNALSQNLKMPNEKFDNYFIEDLSEKLGKDNTDNNVFIEHLSNYIDTAFLESNKRLCKNNNMSLTEFVPKSLISKNEIVDIINIEIEKRRKNPEEIIQYYKRLTGQWAHFCFYSHQKNIFNKIALIYKHMF